MSEPITRETLAGRVGETFRLHADAPGPLEIELIEVRALGTGGGRPADLRRDPFALLFRGPPEPVLPQRIYKVEHEAVGAHEWFLVPVGPDRQGQRYEAVFN